jgi:DNA-binding MarR family transcriptional regulator/N-acetylglutamate synthase-like GNAT family acetyltransferase
MQVDAVRRFNRFYTGRVGALREGLLGSPYPLPQARLIYELGSRGACAATELSGALDLDAGYLSRLLQGLGRRGLLKARRSADDARRSVLALTPKGRKAYALLDARSRDEVKAMLGKLTPGRQSRLVQAMHAVEKILGQDERTEAISLRGHRPGDIGWVVQRHGALYAAEHGYDERFEALVAGIAARFIERLDAARERCWIAELAGEPVGCVFLVKKTRQVAQLRLLLVEPAARGRGLGERLVGECIAFARAAGYRRLVLWTQADLFAARRIYREKGFGLVKKEPHRSFGRRLVGEYWALELARPGGT